MDQMSLGSQSHFTIAIFTYGRNSHGAKSVSHGKEDAAVLSVHTCFTGEFLREVKSHTKTLHFSSKVKVLTTLSVSQKYYGCENSFYRFS